MQRNEANSALVCLLTSLDGVEFVEFKSTFFAFFDGLFREARFRLVFAWKNIKCSKLFLLISIK